MIFITSICQGVDHFDLLLLFVCCFLGLLLFTFGYKKFDLQKPNRFLSLIILEAHQYEGIYDCLFELITHVLSFFFGPSGSSAFYYDYLLLSDILSKSISLILLKSSFGLNIGSKLTDSLFVEISFKP